MPADEDINLLEKRIKELGISNENISKSLIKGLIVNAERRYNRYEIYQPGDTFEERLIGWLNRFENDSDRNIAFNLVKNIRYISRNELRVLGEFALDFASTVTWQSIFKNKSYTDRNTLQIFQNEMKRNIFIAFSDDVGFDYLRRLGRRRFNSMEKENFIECYKLSDDAIEDTFKTIKNVKRIFLLDQICASGTTLLRFEGDQSHGKLRKFFTRWRKYISGKDVYYVPLIASSFIESVINENLSRISGDATGIAETTILPILIIPISKWLLSPDGKINDTAVGLLEKYYKFFKEDSHSLKGGGSLFGYGNGGLSIVIGTNCPNNTIFLIWHTNNGWSPLFPRITHHKPTPTTLPSFDIESQKDMFIDRCSRPISSSCLDNNSIVELSNFPQNYIMAASLDPNSEMYKNLTDSISPNLDVIEIEDDAKLGDIITNLKHSIREKSNFEIRVKNDTAIINDTDMDKHIANSNLVIPFLAVDGPRYIPPPQNIIEEGFIIPAILFSLSSRYRSTTDYNIDRTIYTYADFIEKCKIRTEKLLYLPLESPSITFKRTFSIIDNYNKLGVNYNNVCLLPSYDASSILTAIVSNSFTGSNICIPSSINKMKIISDNNLILIRQIS